MRSRLRALLILLSIPPFVGCQSPVRRLLSEVKQIQTDSGEHGQLHKVFVALCGRPPIEALQALSEPKNQYISRNQFVTAIVGPTDITIYHKNLVRVYPLRRSLFVPFDWSPFWGEYKSERDILCKHLIGATSSHEYVVVCDSNLNPIESETKGLFSPASYPRLLTKYADFTDVGFKNWQKEQRITHDAPPMKRMRDEIQELRSEVGESDPTVKVFVVLPGLGTGRALSKLNDPRMLYLAHCRYVTVVVGRSDVMLYCRDRVRSYPLRPTVYELESTPILGLSREPMTEKEALYRCLSGNKVALFETTVVCDLQLNPIEMELELAPAYPTLLEKYGAFTQDEYNAWFKRSQVK